MHVIVQNIKLIMASWISFNFCALKYMIDVVGAHHFMNDGNRYRLERVYEHA